VKLILEIQGEDGERAEYRVMTAFPVTLGRGYDNDVILSDPHIGARHLTIDVDAEGWKLTDHGTVNPTQVNGRAVRGVDIHLSSGDSVRAGTTTLRVFAPDHLVDDPVRMQKVNPVFLHLTRPLNVWSYFTLAVLGVLAWTYATVWSDDTTLTLAGAAAAASVCALVWAALWSVAGRLIRRRSFFLAHLAMISLYLALGAGIAFISALADFLFSENQGALALGYALNGALLGFLLYGALSLATLMKKRKRITAAAFLVGGILLGLFSIGIVQEDKFNANPLYPYRLLPFVQGLAPARTVDDFVTTSARVFSSDTFDQEKAETGGKKK
jgi:hypothetical protein